MRTQADTLTGDDFQHRKGKGRRGMEKVLYEWQEECLRRWQEHGGRGIAQAVTGSGKTFLALTAAARLEYLFGEKLKVKIVVPTGALTRQWVRAVREFFAHAPQGAETGKKIGLRGNGHKDPADCQYMIYVINSARYELARQILEELKRGEAVFLIADECHHYVSGQNRMIFDFIPHIKEYEERFFSLGLSATLPSGEDRKYLSSVLGKRIYSYGMAEASAENTVCQYEIYHITLFFGQEEREAYDNLTDRMTRLFAMLSSACPSLEKAGHKERFEILRNLTGNRDKKIAETASKYLMFSYRRKSLVCLARARTFCAYDLVRRLEPKEKILIFGERISQAEELYRMLGERYPGKVGRYHSQMGQQANKNVLERFRSGDIRILIACKAVDEGVDIPDVAVGIILSGTSTRRQRIQRLGRIIRKKPGKSQASLYYLHVSETSEDSCFLPAGGGSALFELEYVSGSRAFSNPAYDCRARELLEDMAYRGAGEEKLKEARRCLSLGCVRSDWMREKEYLEEKIREAKYVSDRNYWVCMKRLGSEGKPQ